MIRKLKGTVPYENKWVRFHADEVEFPDGKTGEYAYMDRVDSGPMIIAMTDDRELVVVREWRYPIQNWTYCFPFGGVENGESTLDTAKRELFEETGYRAREWTGLGSITIDPGGNSQVTPVFLATGLEQDHSFENVDQHEIQEVHILSLEEIASMIALDEIKNGWLLAGFAKLQNYLQRGL